ncbi:MAG: hypothetical protein V3W44_05065 [Dehalococcoidales bacterium]
MSHHKLSNLEVNRLLAAAGTVASLNGVHDPIRRLLAEAGYTGESEHFTSDTDGLKAILELVEDAENEARTAVSAAEDAGSKAEQARIALEKILDAVPQ